MRSTATAKKRRTEEEEALDKALIKACKHFSGLAEVDRLLAAGASVRAEDDLALYYACESGNLALVDCLLAAGASVHSKTCPPLGIAAGKGHVDVLDRLLTAGASATSKDGEVALYGACGRADVASVQRLLAAGAPVARLSSRLLEATAMGGAVAILDLLLAHGLAVWPALGDDTLKNALKVACMYGNLEMLERLMALAPMEVLRSESETYFTSWSSTEKKILAFLPTNSGLAAISAPQTMLAPFLTWPLERACLRGHLAVADRLLAFFKANNVPLDVAHAASLEAACQWGHAAVVDRLLTEKAVSAAMLDHCLQYAVAGPAPGAAAVASRLLEAGASFSSESLPKMLKGLFEKGGDAGILDVLLVAGARLSQQQLFDGVSQICQRCLNTSHPMPPEWGIALVERLLSLDSDSVLRHPMLLAWASGLGLLAWVERILAARVHTVAGLCNAVLHASSAGRAEVVARLLAAGARPHDDGAALKVACEHGHAAIVDMLLAAGVPTANVLTQPLHAAVKRGHVQIALKLLAAGANGHGNDEECLRTACAQGYDALAEALLLDGADVRVQNEVAVRSASEHGHAGIVAHLLRAGADVHADNDYALRHACKNGHAAVVALLLQAGADVHADNDQALRWASSNGRTAVLGQLLAAGVDVHTDREVAIRMASSHGHVDATAALLAAGADVSRIEWARLDRLAQLRVLVALPRAQFLALSRHRRSLWLRILLPPIMRLRRALHRIRYRLDRPPTVPLGEGPPTREQLIAHLATAGRRFAREYWAEGLPLFFPGLALGPVPDEFLY